MKSEGWIAKPRGRLSPWTFVALLVLLAWGALRPAGAGAAPGVVRLVKADPGWTYGVKFLNPYPSSYPSDWPWTYTPKSFIALKETLLFWGYDSMHGYELWRSDGTAAGTVLVKDLRPGNSSSTLEKGIYFGDSYLFLTVENRSLWKTDGTTSGTVLLKNFGYYPPISGLAGYKGRVYFCRGTSTSDAELWRTDGTTSGTEKLKTLHSTVNVGFYEKDGYLYIQDANNINRTDGTAAGTEWVRDTRPDDQTSHNAPLFLNYCAWNGTYSLYKNNGENIAPTVLKEGFISVWSGLIRKKPDDTAVYFCADDGVHGLELWKSNGTAAGTTMVLDLQPGAEPSNAMSLTAYNGALYFAVSKGGGHGVALWKSDGSAAGTKLLREFHPAANPISLSIPSTPINLGGVLYFSADDGDGHWRLWRSDGTASGTVQLPCYELTGGSDFGASCVVGERMFLAGPLVPAVGYTPGRVGLWAVDLAKPNAVRGWDAYQ